MNDPPYSKSTPKPSTLSVQRKWVQASPSRPTRRGGRIGSPSQSGLRPQQTRTPRRESENKTPPSKGPKKNRARFEGTREVKQRAPSSLANTKVHNHSRGTNPTETEEPREITKSNPNTTLMETRWSTINKTETLNNHDPSQERRRT